MTWTDKTAFTGEAAAFAGELHDKLAALPSLALSTLDSESTALFVVDMVEGFARQGAMASPRVEALIAPIELATGHSAYFLGKPNPLMMRHGLRRLGVSTDEAAIIGDRMDTDVIAGVESGIDTVLVLSGVTTREEMSKFPYRPRYVLNGVGDVVG